MGLEYVNKKLGCGYGRGVDPVRKLYDSHREGWVFAKVPVKSLKSFARVNHKPGRTGGTKRKRLAS